MPVSRFKKRLFAHLAHESYEPAPVERVAADLGIAPEEPLQVSPVPVTTALSAEPATADI